MITEFLVTAGEQPKRLDVFLVNRERDISRSGLQRLIELGRIRINNQVVKPSQKIKPGDRITMDVPKPEPLELKGEAIPLEVLYEDDYLLVLNKPAGIVVHPAPGNWTGTLVNALLHRFTQLSGVAGSERPGIVHRLDRDTSGVLLVARTDAAHRDLARQFAGREVEKVYLALVHGVPRAAEGRIETPIERDPVRRRRMTTRTGRGRAARTTYRVLRKWPKFALLEVRIHTGRTHQIRVHLSSIGHPVAGDTLYGAPPAAQDRFFLHSHRIGFRSPAVQESVEVVSPLPPELESWLAGL